MKKATPVAVAKSLKTAGHCGESKYMALARSKPATGSPQGVAAPEGGRSGGRAGSVWIVTAAGTVAAAGLFGSLVWGLATPAHHLPFLPLMALFAVAEMAVVHLEVGSRTYTYSPVEVPLVLALLTLQPRLVVVAWMLGGAIALGAVRRQTPVKLAYNLACFAVESVAATLLFRAITTGRDLVGSRTLLAVFAAALVASAIGIASVVLAVRLTEGRQPGHGHLRYASFGLASSAVTSALMLIGVVLQEIDTQALWLLAAPVLAALLVQRAFTIQVRFQGDASPPGVDESDASLTHDPLTGLPNRTVLVDHLRRLLDEPGASDIACLLVDIDDFGAVNERYGPATGDQLLVVTAQRLSGCLREGDLASRFEADQLAVVAHVSPDDSTQEATALARRIADSLGRPASLGAETVNATTGIGIAVSREGDSPEELLRAARSALAAAKRAGTGRVELFGRARRAESVKG